MKKYPFLKTYRNEYRDKVAMPVGGIGTGSISFGGYGDLRDWENMNRPAKQYVPKGQTSPFFAVRYAAGGKTVAKILEGPLPLGSYEGAHGVTVPNHGLPRFRKAVFKTAYPFGELDLEDVELPLKVKAQVFNPLIPGDAERSGYPVFAIRYLIKNSGNIPAEVSVCGTVPNYIGESAFQTQRNGDGDPLPTGASKNRNCLHDTARLKGVFMEAPELDLLSEQKGSLYLASPSTMSMSRRSGWSDLSWGNSLLDFWDDFSADGEIEERSSAHDKPAASLCLKKTLQPGETASYEFLISWHFPNRKSWNDSSVNLGNYYCTVFKDAADAAERFASESEYLESESMKFVKALLDSSLPEEYKEAALFNLSTLKSQTCFRTADGKFYGWEGCHDNKGSCLGNCTHVWNYELSLPFLFPELARDMRETEFLHVTNDEGHMAFRVDLPLKIHETAKKVAAADGQMGCIMRACREWMLSGDDAFLQKIYPKVKKAMEFCWIPKGWDADMDGIMEGCQHNTMDVEYYGPNPQMGFWYLGALKAMEKMALAMNDKDFAGKCASLFKNGSAKIDRELFNGEYYEHYIIPPGSAENIASGLMLGAGAKNMKEPELQLGAGCLIDQLVGQYLASSMGLGELSDSEKHRKTLESIFRYNFRTSFFDHFNHTRSYTAGDEAAALMCTYPRGNRPACPFPYANEVMTGFEYVLAIHMIYMGMDDEALTVVSAIRERYDGRKRSPFDEAEWGHHYARAMAAWGLVNASAGLNYSGKERIFSIKKLDGRWFWAFDGAWGLCEIQGESLIFETLHGELKVESINCEGKTYKVDGLLKNGKRLEISL